MAHLVDCRNDSGSVEQKERVVEPFLKRPEGIGTLFDERLYGKSKKAWVDQEQKVCL